jgi:hypothetical protein
MHKLTGQIIVSIFILWSVSACRKGSLPEEQYFGFITVTLLDLPNTPKVDVRFNGNKVGEINPGRHPRFMLSAGVPGTLAFYKENTDSLVVDTVITVPKNDEKSFRIAYSQDIGLKGFVSDQTQYAADSVYFQLFNSLDTRYYPATDFEVHFFAFNNETFELEPTGIVLKAPGKGVLSPIIILPTNDKNGQPLFYTIKLKAPGAADFFVFPPYGMDFVSFSVPPGGLYIANMKDKAENGEWIEDYVPL